MVAPSILILDVVLTEGMGLVGVEHTAVHDIVVHTVVDVALETVLTVVHLGGPEDLEVLLVFDGRLPRLDLLPGRLVMTVHHLLDVYLQFGPQRLQHELALLRVHLLQGVHLEAL